jgi:hypothetical protein
MLHHHSKIRNCFVQTLSLYRTSNSTTHARNLTIMSLLSQPSLLARQKERRAANNNYSRLSKTLCKKFLKLCCDYDAEIYFVAFRNGRYHGFVTTDEKGQPWSPPDYDALVCTFFCFYFFTSLSFLTFYVGQDVSCASNQIPMQISSSTLKADRCLPRSFNR